jgi:hypothetical protein
MRYQGFAPAAQPFRFQPFTEKPKEWTVNRMFGPAIALIKTDLRATQPLEDRNP